MESDVIMLLLIFFPIGIFFGVMVLQAIDQQIIGDQACANMGMRYVSANGVVGLGNYKVKCIPTPVPDNCFVSHRVTVCAKIQVNK